MSMRIDIPHILLENSGLSESDILREVAIVFYRSGSISLGRAAEFARIPKMDFQRHLSESGIPLNYDENDLLEDMEAFQLSKN